MTDFQERLKKLGLSQYIDSFLSEGFDSWDTLVDITESDLEYLNVRLGHRRKLQRAIAEARGYGGDRALPGGRRGSIDASYQSDDSIPIGKDEAKISGTAPAPGSGAKRKYRRHPRPDENAPERPASAYVIFSNQIREELKGKELTFTEIAKTVGERWQVLEPKVREAFESKAAAAKENYYADLAQYKRTEQYARYQEYLADFKAKHAGQADGKRAKLENQVSGSTHSTRSNSHGGDGHFEQTALPNTMDNPMQALRRSASSPTSGLAHITHPIPPILPVATSPAAHGYGLQSPLAREPYSPMSAASSSTPIQPGFDLAHHRRPVMITEPRLNDPSTTGAPLSVVRHSPWSSSEMQQHISAAQARLEASARLPPLLSTESTILSETSLPILSPYSGSLLPMLDAPKSERVLPAPVSLATRTLTVPGSSAPSSILAAPGEGQWPALLRVTELARDADLPTNIRTQGPR